MTQPNRWLYEPDERPKRKHHWNEPQAGFVEVRGALVGKCPSTISVPQAEHLLNDNGVPYHSPRAPADAWPDRIYVVHDGVVYRATWTVPGRSFHAFPELPEKLRELPKRVRAAILEMADRLGCRAEAQRWMDR